MNDPLRAWLYPELRHCRSHLERTEAFHASRTSRERWTLSLLFIPFLAAVGLATRLFLLHRPAWMNRMWLMAFGAAIGASAAFFIAAGLRSVRRTRIRQFLLARGVPLCMKCGYDLRGLPPHTQEPRCPECAHGISPEAVKILQAASDP